MEIATNCQFLARDLPIQPGHVTFSALPKVDPVLQHFLRHLEQGEGENLTLTLPVTALARIFSDSWVSWLMTTIPDT